MIVFSIDLNWWKKYFLNNQPNLRSKTTGPALAYSWKSKLVEKPTWTHEEN